MQNSILDFISVNSQEIKPIIEKSFHNFFKGQVVTELSTDEIELLKKSTQVAEAPLSIKNRKPFILDGNLFYWEKYYQQEKQIADWIVSRIEQDKNNPNNELIKQVKDLLNKNEIDWQEIASINSLNRSFSIITGGPGTGKTTTVTKFLSKYLLQNTNNNTIYAVAPTAKAARRMKESMVKTAEEWNLNTEHKQIIKEINPSTIHKLLQTIPGKENKFLYNQFNPILADLIIIDEASMIDLSLMHSLLMAIDGSKTKVIMLGDPNQLKSVAAGSIFGDLCKVLPSITKENPFDVAVELKKCHRMIVTNNDGKKEENNIYNLSQFILHYNPNMDIHEWTNHQTDQVTFEDLTDFNTFPDNFEKKVIQQGYKLLNESKEVEEALKYLNKTKVLCATNKGKLGVSGINEWVEQKLNVSDKKTKFYHNQPILITENDYNLGVFNGDTGVVRYQEEGNDKSSLIFYIYDKENNIREIPAIQLKSYKTNYAMTIHKSQGSEYDSVILVLPSSAESKILSKELIYTGVTRAKNALFIYAKKEVFKTGIENEVMRASGMAKQIKNSTNG